MGARKRLCAGLAGAAILSASAPVSGETLPRALDMTARGTDSSIAVAAGGESVYQRRATEMRAPASVQKLLLSMAMFDEFGPGHRISTKVMTRSVTDGTASDLWVVGGGDPTVVSGEGDEAHTGLKRLARPIVRSGIRAVTGRVIADASLFEADWDASGWQPWARSFVAKPTALALDGNTYANPPRAFAAALTKVLRRRGVSVGGRPATGRAPGNAKVVARVRSVPLRSMVRTMNEVSSNFTAEMLGKLLGARTLGVPGTISKGARALERWAHRQGATIVAHDSCGLSYDNRVAASEIVELLEVARRRPWGRALYRALPSPGEGTLAGRLPGIDAHAKTGTIWSGHSALAGWVRLRKGGLAEFAILARNQPKALEDETVRIIAKEALVPEASSEPEPR
ncbi:MAG: D-alanyl-D-alanine carboxypeptidase [Actinomycetota bacterium]|nr:D-alanyl-D-alanine carboxypeptidase [Actinomycetota bacterium]